MRGVGVSVIAGVPSLRSLACWKDRKTMARPIKEGLDYFMLDCCMNDKIKLIEAEFGVKGFAIIVKLYQKIYKERGYYCEWNDDASLLFVAQLGGNSGVTKNLIDSIVAVSIRRGIFSKKLYDQYKILTSQRIQEQYFDAVSRRERVEVKKEYLLVKVGNNFVFADRNQVNVDRNQVNVCSSTQSRVEKSKVKDINIYSPADAERLITEIIDHLNEKTGSHYQPNAKEHVRLILKLLSRNYTKQDFLTVIDKKYEEWNGTEYAKFLRPSTLFGKRFDEYLNQIPVNSKATPMTKFHNFEQHSYDFKDLESKLFANVKG